MIIAHQQSQPRMGMRVPGVQNVANRVVSVGHMVGPRMPLAPPPPPPPYPGPPPPYPGPGQVRQTILFDSVIHCNSWLAFRF